MCKNLSPLPGISCLILTIDFIPNQGSYYHVGGYRIIQGPQVFLQIDHLQPASVDLPNSARAHCSPLHFVCHPDSCAEGPCQPLGATSLLSRVLLHHAPLCVLLFQEGTSKFANLDSSVKENQKRTQRRLQLQKDMVRAPAWVGSGPRMPPTPSSAGAQAFVSISHFLPVRSQ